VIDFLESNWLALAFLAALAAAFLLLRNRTTKVSSSEEIGKQGEPVVIVIFSNV
jgi:hypothetical protein